MTYAVPAYAALVCSPGTFKGLTLLKAALSGKDATLVCELATAPLPSRRILMSSCWGLFLGLFVPDVDIKELANDASWCNFPFVLFALHSSR